MSEPVREPLIVDHDPDQRGRPRPVRVVLEVPPRATTNGWGTRPGHN